MHGFLQLLLSLLPGLLGGLEILGGLPSTFAGLLGLLDSFADLALEPGPDGFAEGFSILSVLLEGEAIQGVVEGVLEIILGLFEELGCWLAFGDPPGLLGGFGEISLLGGLPGVLEWLGLCTLWLTGRLSRCARLAGILRLGLGLLALPGLARLLALLGVLGLALLLTLGCLWLAGLALLGAGLLSLGCLRLTGLLALLRALRLALLGALGLARLRLLALSCLRLAGLLALLGALLLLGRRWLLIPDSWILIPFFHCLYKLLRCLLASLLGGLEILGGLLAGFAGLLGLFDGGLEVVGHGGLSGPGEGLLLGRALLGFGGLLQGVGDALVGLLFGLLEAGRGFGGLAALFGVFGGLFEVVAFGGPVGAFEGGLFAGKFFGRLDAFLEGLLCFACRLHGFGKFFGHLLALFARAVCLLAGLAQISLQGFLGSVGQGAALGVFLFLYGLLHCLLYGFLGLLAGLSELLGGFLAEGALGSFAGGLGKIVFAGGFLGTLERVIGRRLLARILLAGHFRLLELVGKGEGLFLLLFGEAHGGPGHGLGRGLEVFVADGFFCLAQVCEGDGVCVLLELLDVFECVPGLRGELCDLFLLLFGSSVELVGEVADGGLLLLGFGYLSELFGGALELSAAGGLGGVLQGFTGRLGKIGGGLLGLLDRVGETIGEVFELLLCGFGKLLGRLFCELSGLAFGELLGELSHALFGLLVFALPGLVEGLLIFECFGHGRGIEGFFI